jgi:hypothetical protein
MVAWFASWAHPAHTYNVVGVIFKIDVYAHSKIQHTTVQYNQQLSKHTRTITRLAIGPLAHHLTLETFAVFNNVTRANNVHNPF